MSGSKWLNSITQNLAALIGSRGGCPLRRRFRVSALSGGFSLEARVLLSNSPAGGEFQIDPSGEDGRLTGSSGAQSVAMADDGSFVVTWTGWDEEFFSDVSYVQRFTADGAPLGSATIVNGYPFGANINGAIAMNGDGDFVVAWQRNMQFEGVFARRFDAGGAALGNDIQVDSTAPFSSGMDPSATMSADGRFVVTWSEGHIMSQVYDAQGNAVGSAIELGIGAQSSVSMSADGDFVVTWTGSDGSGDGIFGQRFDAQGVTVGSVFRVNDHTANHQRDSSVAMNPDGTFIVTWTSLAQDGDNEGVFARRYEADGDAIGSEFRVNSTTANTQYLPSIATSGNAGFIITWTSIGQYGNDRGIVAQWYDSQGNAIDGEVQVNSYTDGVQWYPSVAMAPNGEAVIVWGSGSADGSHSGLYGQRFHRDNAEPTDISLTGDTVLEGVPAGTVVGTLTATDPDAGETFTYSLVSGSGDSGNSDFVIVGDELRTAAVFDFEVQTSHSVRVRATDSFGASFEQILTIHIGDGIASDLTLSHQSVAENQAKGTAVGLLNVNDAPDAKFTYSLVNGAGASGNARFSVIGNQIRTKTSFNFEAQSNYSIRIRVRGSEGYEQIKVFTITVTDANEAPTALKLSSSSVSEGQPLGTTVGEFNAADVDAGSTLTYSLVNGSGAADNSLFAVDGSALVTDTEFDFESRASYSIRVRVTDEGGMSVERIFQIKVTNVNEAPTGILLSNSSVQENRRAGTRVGTLATQDPDAKSKFQYSLVGGTGGDDNVMFRFVGNQLQMAAVLDFETQATYTIRVRVTDQSGAWYERTFVINLIDEIGR